MKNTFTKTDKYILYFTFVLAARLTLGQVDSTLDQSNYWHSNLSAFLAFGKLICSMAMLYMISDYFWKRFSGKLEA